MMIEVLIYAIAIAVLIALGYVAVISIEAKCRSSQSFEYSRYIAPAYLPTDSSFSEKKKYLMFQQKRIRWADSEAEAERCKNTSSIQRIDKEYAVFTCYSFEEVKTP